MPRQPKYRQNIFPPLPRSVADRSDASWRPTYNISKDVSNSGIYHFDYYDKYGDRIRRTLLTKSYRQAISNRKRWKDLDKLVRDLVVDFKNRPSKVSKARLKPLAMGTEYHIACLKRELKGVKLSARTRKQLSDLIYEP